MPNALMYGISDERFPHLNPTKLAPYRISFERKRKLDLKDQESIAYLNGIYTKLAISTAFGGKFPEKPIEFFTASNKKEPDDIEINERQAVAEMATWAKSLELQGLGQ